IGFDCGPGNALMDHWCRRHTGDAYDDGGRWAATGHVHAALLAQFQSERYFDLPPPKSTGRDLFNPAWMETNLRSAATAPAARQDRASSARSIRSEARKKAALGRPLSYDTRALRP